MKYYTDDELIEMVEFYGETSIDSNWLANRIRDRFEQKEKRSSRLMQRVDVAANYLGHQFITDLVEEEQY